MFLEPKVITESWLGILHKWQIFTPFLPFTEIIYHIYQFYKHYSNTQKEELKNHYQIWITFKHLFEKEQHSCENEMKFQ